MVDYEGISRFTFSCDACCDQIANTQADVSLIERYGAVVALVQVGLTELLYGSEKQPTIRVGSSIKLAGIGSKRIAEAVNRASTVGFG